MFRELRLKNQGVCSKTGKTFGELMEHFVVGGDEIEIAALHAPKKDQKTTGRAAELMDKAPGAAAKLKANGG